MEKHSCKLCFKIFSNGRALGGHMRSHLINLPTTATQTTNSSEETESAPSAWFSEDEDEDDRQLGFVGSVVLQDTESETESSKNPTRRRSKRIRKSSSRRRNSKPPSEDKKKCKFVRMSPESSSVSDVTTEVDVAYCLMMMSRDNKWKHKQEEDEEEEDDESNREIKTNHKSREKYRCETCSRTFRSYQALGGHRASHRKSQGQPLPEEALVAAAAKADSKIHQCPYCFRVFASGQALGGHKRSHSANYNASTSLAVSPDKRVVPATSNGSVIDLNLPATVEDDGSGQAELSSLSDSEFVFHTYRKSREIIT